MSSITVPLEERRNSVSVADKYFLCRKESYIEPATTSFTESGEEVKPGTVKDGKIYLGEGIWIDKSIYDEVRLVKEPAKAVSTASRKLWGVKKLSQRCVKRSKTSLLPALSPNKKSIISRLLHFFLKLKNYPDHLRNNEMDKMNRYLGNAISYAKRQVAANPEEFISDDDDNPAGNFDPDSPNDSGNEFN